MGWWDCSVFGGDPPLDALAHLAQAMGLRGLTPPDEWKPGRAETVRQRADRLIAAAGRIVAESRASARRGTILTLAMLALELGVKIPAPVRDEAIALLEEDIKGATRWIAARKRDGNGHGMLPFEIHTRDLRRHLVERLRVYDGTPERCGVLTLVPLLPHIPEIMAALKRRAAAKAGLAEAAFEPALSPYKEGAYRFTDAQADTLRALLPELLAAPETCVPQWTEEAAVTVQVAATLLMGAGAEMPTAFRALAIEATISDPWAQRDDERADEMADLRARIAAYGSDGPDVVRTITLADAVQARHAIGARGLVNKT